MSRGTIRGTRKSKGIGGMRWPCLKLSPENNRTNGGKYHSETNTTTHTDNISADIRIELVQRPSNCSGIWLE